MHHEAHSRSGWAVLAGLVLLIDGFAALLLSGTLFLLSLFPPAAAVEGRPSVDQSMYGPAVGLLAFAIACLWVGQRAIRGNRNGRIVGVVLAGLVVALLASLPLTNPGLDLPELAILMVLAAAQVLVIVALLRWPMSASQGRRDVADRDRT